MWKKVSEDKPKNTGHFKCFGIINKGSDFEVETKFDAWYDGEYWTDKSYEDLTGINESVMWWYDFDNVKNPKIINTDIFEWFCKNGCCDGTGLCEYQCEDIGIRFKDTKRMVTKEFAESYE